MTFDYQYFEEEHLSQGYDLKILSRLWPYVRPYLLVLIGSLFCVGIITFSELALPYMTKIAIDSYIIPQTKNEQSLKDIHQESSQKRYLSLTSDQTAKPAIEAIIKKHPDIFEQNKEHIRISYSLLDQLTEKELRLLRSKDISGINKIVLIFLVIIVVNFGTQFGQKLMMEYMGQNIIHDLRMHLFDHTQSLSLTFFNRQPLGRLVTRLTNDIQNMYEFFTNFLTFFIKDIFMFLGITIVLLSLNWQLALITFSVLPLMVLASKVFAQKSREIFRQLRVKLAEINSKFSETISGIRIIQLFQQEDNNYSRFSRLNQQNYLAGMHQIRILALFMPVVEALGFVSIGLVIYFGGSRVLGQTLSIGALVAFISYIRMFFRPVRDMAEKFNLMQNAMASAERIFQIMDTKPRNQLPSSHSLHPKQANKSSIRSLTFSQVYFSYDQNRSVLKDISFNLNQFEHIAIVGPTGSGKTSLIHLILGFYPPMSGKILINNQNLQSWDLNHLRARFALVMQDPFLFSGTIYQNILQGNPCLTEKQLSTVLKLSHCSTFVNRLPQGLNTKIGEGGVSLSTGQKQLIGIARAFARDPEVLILDEATSAIDSETEYHIQDALKDLMHHRTSITIAHRLTTAKMADRILVLHKGNLVERGSHKELMAEKGLYFKLTQMQNV